MWGIRSGIYAIINLVTGKTYVGQAFKFNKRWSNHEVELRLGRHCNPYLQASWNKYGEQNFIFIILERCECNVELLTWREQHWMDKLKAANREFGYNQAPAAGSSLGYKHSEETKQAWSEYRQANAKPRSQEVKDKIGAAQKGRVFSPETKAKMAAAKLGKKQSVEHIAIRTAHAKGNTYNTGRKQSKETIAKRVLACTGKKRSAEFGQAVAVRNKLRVATEETKERQRQSALLRWSKV